MIRKLLAARGFHYLATRFGTKNVRRLAFDEKYRSGHWRFVEDGGQDLSAIVRRHLRHGDLLVLGCGTASVLEGLEAAGLNSALGVDVSAEALALASRFASDKVSFRLGDMETVEGEALYDEILFSESIYYIPARRQVAVLNRWMSRLKPGGVIVVTLAAGRHGDILQRLLDAFHVVENLHCSSAKRRVVVLQAREQGLAQQ